MLFASLPLTELRHPARLPLKLPQAVKIVFRNIDCPRLGLEVDVAQFLERAGNSFHRGSTVRGENLNVSRAPVSHQQISFVVKVHAVRPAFKVT